MTPPPHTTDWYEVTNTLLLSSSVVRLASYSWWIRMRVIIIEMDIVSRDTGVGDCSWAGTIAEF